jgi:hypothetical protein
MTVTPLLGDRAAWDVTNHPDKHASDLSNGTPINHVPEGLEIGDSLVWNGTEWVAGPTVSVPSIMTLGTREGVLELGATPLKIYNQYGHNRTITKVFLAVDTAPTGDDLIVDVLINGISIFTLGSEAVILAGETTGEETTFDDPSWISGNYLTWEILQVGSSISGADLVVHVIHEQALGGS